jgi:hypothetical protein
LAVLGGPLVGGHLDLDSHGWPFRYFFRQGDCRTWGCARWIES